MPIVRRMPQPWIVNRNRPIIQAGEDMYVFKVRDNVYKAYCLPRESPKVFRALVQTVCGHGGQVRGSIPASVGRYAKSSAFGIAEIAQARWIKLIRVHVDRGQ